MSPQVLENIPIAIYVEVLDWKKNRLLDNFSSIFIFDEVKDSQWNFYSSVPS